MALTGQVLDIYVDYIICLRKGKQGAIEAYLYAVACHHEELIALRQEGNALEEHLHRAVKDMVVNFLQILGERILEVYSYIPHHSGHATTDIEFRSQFLRLCGGSGSTQGL